MRIQVSFFASHREIVGTDTAEVDLADGATAADLVQAVGIRYPALKPHLPSARVAINEEYRLSNAVLREGDRAAIIPPVSGG